MLRMTGGGLRLCRSGVDADGVADVFEAVALEERREAALEYGDLLRSAVHQCADEHDQAGAVANLAICLLRGEHTADAGDGETLAVFTVDLRDALLAGHRARAAGQAALPLLRNLQAGAVLLQIGDGQPLHVVLGEHVQQILEFRATSY